MILTGKGKAFWDLDCARTQSNKTVQRAYLDMTQNFSKSKAVCAGQNQLNNHLY